MIHLSIWQEVVIKWVAMKLFTLFDTVFSVAHRDLKSRLEKQNHSLMFMSNLISH